MLSAVAYSQSASLKAEVLKPAPNSFIIDDSLNIIVWNTQDKKLQKGNKIFFDTISDSTFTVVSTTQDSVSNTKMILQNKSFTTTLYTTSYPLVHITTSSTIKNEPKVPAQFQYYAIDTMLVKNIGIEWRGNISLTFPKKTFDIEFREATSPSNSKDVVFSNLREDDDYILDGLYNEPLRLNAKIAQDLWLEMHPLTYQKQEKKAKAGGTGNFVELFLNNSYQGLYLLQEQIDRKLLRLKKNKKDTIRGLLYKAGYYADGSTFKSAPTYNNALPRWAGFEMVYPFENYTAHWEPLYQAINNATQTDDVLFVEQVDTYFNIDNCIDYFLFINLTRATDNLGKNYYLARYQENEPLFFVPWDLDGTFGTVIDGRKMNIVEDVLTNGLFERLWQLNPNKYRSLLAKRWQQLRKTTFSEAALLARIHTLYNEFEKNHVYERETLRWQTNMDTTKLNNTLDWVTRRLQVLDAKFAN